jgi:pSer/pThr/pTyr-binding forkhead associated (FHA) protein
MGFLNLAVEFNGKLVKQYTLGDERKVLVGRSSECDVVIDNLGVSRTHCELFWAGHCWVLQDLHSNNGTVVNGKKVVTHNVNDGDEITISKFKLTCKLPQQDELEFAIETPQKGAGYGESTIPIDQRRGASPKPETKVKGFVTIEGQGRKTIVLQKPVFVIGKAENADVRVEGFFIRKKHALIVRDEVGFLLVDTSGRTATFLNEATIDCERLRDGDLIRVGKTVLKFSAGMPNY